MVFHEGIIEEMSNSSLQQQTRERAEAETVVPPQDEPTPVEGLGANTGVHPVKRELSRPEIAEVGEVGDDDESSGPPSEEDEFFARGDSSFPPAAMDTEPEHSESELPPPPSPQLLERRARLRRVVGVVVGAATMLTGLVGAKALAGHPDKVAISDSSLSVPNHVVPSIALGASTESAPALANTIEAKEKPTVAAAAEIAPASSPPAEPAAGATPTGSGENSKASDDKAASAAAAARRLPIIDVEIPTAPDPATDEQWQSAARNLSSQDFKAADQAFAELGKRTDPATREAARLARAVWWTANGKQGAVRPVLADLAENATTPSVKQHARELLRTN
jgi:hypothetical protein